ncbi:zinc-binding dehydrogenase [Spirilliplanes yamanashiensis]|uniref:Oxidoreductase n=1 Tax=Spirilliplanes yamanashiensis TaxID=42233 RepID=A0A8J3YDQ4_9ACTN|nr:zinc-binding dehydrogenase [Spirilliplanes yamanashiensis]MDP9818234.1 2-desacetyl-2-hydroxyethyl bacteriochlorophyllide A dehydrogenase [Spirilliplanes yamanashiensis]GIJ06738.1 oxidoreductase [Spirilliplanes yamanashiensis]
MSRTLLLEGPRRLRLADQPSRPLRPGEVRLRSRMSGVSHGTELNLYRGTSAFADRVFDRGLRAFVAPAAGSASSYPVTLGYEMVSEVVEVGAEVTAVRVGDLVHTGTPHQEETVLDVAASLRATYPLVVLPTGERLERALFVSLAAVALQAVHDAEIKLGDSVSVHGLGVIGLLTVQMCRLDGIQTVVGVDPDPHRRELALRLGAGHVLDPAGEGPLSVRIRDLNEGRGMDVAIEVSGTDSGLQGALAAAGLGATVVAAGFYQGGAAHLRLGEEFHHNRLSLIASVGAWGAPDRHAPLWDRRRVLQTATRLLYTDRVSVEGMLERRFPFGDAPAAYRWLDEHPQAAVKVALDYGAGGPG